jgi:uncharacterized damage-inducible protein DinB
VTHNEPAQDFLDSTIKTFRGQKDLAERAIAQLDDAQLHQALDPNTNCIAAIMKHMAGNLLSRWTEFLTTDGEKPWRNRDNEFVDDFTSRRDLMDYWQRGWDCLFAALESLTPDDLTKTVFIRGEPHSVYLAIQRALGHDGYHTGQIILLARVLAKERWEVLTIPRGKSEEYNRDFWQAEKQSK